MKNQRLLIPSIFEETFYYYKKWGRFNFSLIYFDGFKFEEHNYRELDVILSEKEMFFFTDFSEYYGNKMAGGMVLDVDNPDDNYYMFFNKNGKKYGNDEIGYLWMYPYRESNNDEGMYAENVHNGVIYYLASNGEVRSE